MLAEPPTLANSTALIADLPANAPVIGPDGSAVDAGRLPDALAVRVRGHVHDARR